MITIVDEWLHWWGRPNTSFAPLGYPRSRINGGAPGGGKPDDRVTTGLPVHGVTPSRGRKGWVSCSSVALPGEVVSVRIVERKREYAFAEAVEVLSPSPRRVDPPCEAFGKCGGCQLQHADYPYQLEMKREILREAFRRIGKTDVAPEIAPPLDPFGYRYRGRFRVDGEKVGFHGERSHRLVPIYRCPLMIRRDQHRPPGPARTRPLRDRLRGPGGQRRGPGVRLLPRGPVW